MWAMTGVKPTPVQNDRGDRVRRRKVQARREVAVALGPADRRVDERGADASTAFAGQDRCGGDVGGAVGHVQRRAEAGPDGDDADVPPVAAGDQERVVVARQRGAELGADRISRRGTPVGTEHRARRVEHGLFVDEPIDDVELVRRGRPNLDAGRDRHVDRREVAHRDHVGPAEPERHPRCLDRRITERHVDDVIDHAGVERAAGELAEQAAVDPTGVSPVGDGVAVDEMRRRPLRARSGPSARWGRASPRTRSGSRRAGHVRRPRRHRHRTRACPPRARRPAPDPRTPRGGAGSAGALGHAVPPATPPQHGSPSTPRRQSPTTIPCCAVRRRCR